MRLLEKENLSYDEKYQNEPAMMFLIRTKKLLVRLKCSWRAVVVEVNY